MNTHLEIIRQALDAGQITPSKLVALQKKNLPFISEHCTAQKALQIMDHEVAAKLGTVISHSTEPSNIATL